jgi:hypothetical protein
VSGWQGHYSGAMTQRFPILAFLRAVMRGDIGEVYRLRQDPRVTGSLVFRLVAAVADGKHGRKYRERNGA